MSWGISSSKERERDGSIYPSRSLSIYLSIKVGGRKVARRQRPG